MVKEADNYNYIEFTIWRLNRQNTEISREIQLQSQSLQLYKDQHQRLALVETIQFGQFLNCRKVAESWLNVCRSLSKKSANLV